MGGSVISLGIRLEFTFALDTQCVHQALFEC